MAFSAPRSLKEAVNCMFSNLSQTSAPVSSDNVRDSANGVRATWPRMASAAARILESVIVKRDPRRLSHRQPPWREACCCETINHAKNHTLGPLRTSARSAMLMQRVLTSAATRSDFDHVHALLRTAHLFAGVAYCARRCRRGICVEADRFRHG